MKAKYFSVFKKEGAIKHIVVLGNCYLVYRKEPFYFEFSNNPNLLEENVLINLKSSTKFLTKLERIKEVYFDDEELKKLDSLTKYNERIFLKKKRILNKDREFLDYLDNITK